MTRDFGDTCPEATRLAYSWTYGLTPGPHFFQPLSAAEEDL